MHLDVLLRTCSRVLAVHGGTRVVDVPKTELILRCLRSLTRSIREASLISPGLPPESVSLTVIDDHSDTDCVRLIQEELATCAFPAQFVAMDTATGNSASLKRNYEHARTHCRDLIYFVEDDYLHAPTAIAEMLDTHQALRQSLGQEVVIFPCDHPERYQRLYPSYIIATPQRYWRSIQHTSGTFLITRAILEKHWDRYQAFSDYGTDPLICEDNTINPIYREVPCFSPMPTLAMHLQYAETLSPFVDWRQWWDGERTSERNPKQLESANPRYIYVAADSDKRIDGVR